MPETKSRAPGWYGKMPSLGDFASRQLSTTFIAQWDAWLQASIAGSRAQLGERWLETYLTSPVWHFVLMPDVCGANAWSGVMMPSVDRVGRYFPLTVCSELPALPANSEQLNAMLDWLDRLEQLALGTLQTPHTPEQLDAALGAYPLPLPEANGSHGGTVAPLLENCPSGNTFAPLGRERLAPTIAAVSASLLAEAWHGKSVWWAATDPAPMLMCCRGLPDGDTYTKMLHPGAAAMP